MVEHDVEPPFKLNAFTRIFNSYTVQGRFNVSAVLRERDINVLMKVRRFEQPLHL